MLMVNVWVLLSLVSVKFLVIIISGYPDENVNEESPPPPPPYCSNVLIRD